MSRLTEKLPVIKQIKQIDYNYKSNIFGGIIEEDKKENAVWLFHKIVDKLAEYENLGSVEDFKRINHELEVYKRALENISKQNFPYPYYEKAREQWLDNVLDQARKELEDENR